MKLTGVHVGAVRVAAPRYESGKAAFFVWIDTEVASDGQSQPEQIKFAVALPCDPRRPVQQVIADALAQARSLAGAVGAVSLEEWNRLNAEDLAKLVLPDQSPE